MDIPHIPVLPTETSDVFCDIDSGTIIDCTVGFGSHSELILQKNQNIKLICNDRDREALEFSQKRLNRFASRVEFIHGAFGEVLDRVDKSSIRGILADFGVSSLQLDSKNRGFGFSSSELDMRMDRSVKKDAKDILATYRDAELEQIFKDYGEIREYKKLASAITEYRENSPIRSGKELQEAISSKFKYTDNKLLAKIYQALRIEVNSELEEIEKLLLRVKNLKNCKIAFISFHSLEDRLIKDAFKQWAKNCICPSESIKCLCGGDNAIGKIITKKPIIASKEELKTNPRSRSAKLRVFEIE
ncbi:MAG: 16S rRNA (cytosine(1402)-N(4))-methyltransferase RsmH [Campylobacterales bacterium]